jgi:hypothetical protein
MLKNEKAGAIIDLKEAVALTTDYRTENPTGVKAFLIDADLVRQVLDQEGCVGIRIYNGFDKKEDKPSPVIVGVSVNNEDMTAGIMLDRMALCPPGHAVNSSLMD